MKHIEENYYENSKAEFKREISEKLGPVKSDIEKSWTFRYARLPKWIRFLFGITIIPYIIITVIIYYLDEDVVFTAKSQLNLEELYKKGIELALDEKLTDFKLHLERQIKYDFIRDNEIDEISKGYSTRTDQNRAISFLDSKNRKHLIQGFGYIWKSSTSKSSMKFENDSIIWIINKDDNNWPDFTLKRSTNVKKYDEEKLRYVHFDQYFDLKSKDQNKIDQVFSSSKREKLAQQAKTIEGYSKIWTYKSEKNQIISVGVGASNLFNLNDTNYATNFNDFAESFADKILSDITKLKIPSIISEILLEK